MINWTLQIFIKSTWHNPPTTTHTDSLQKKPASNHFPGPDAELERLIWPFLRLAFCVPRDFQTLGEALITVPQWFPVTSVLKKREGMVSKFGCFWLKVKEVCYKPLHFDYIYIILYIYIIYTLFFLGGGVHNTSGLYQNGTDVIPPHSVGCISKWFPYCCWLCWQKPQN